LNPKFFLGYFNYSQPQNSKGGKVGGARAGGEVAAFELGLIVGDLLFGYDAESNQPRVASFLSFAAVPTTAKTRTCHSSNVPASGSRNEKS
jgi:hypothetical protein